MLNPNFVSHLTWSVSYQSYPERSIFVPSHREVCHDKQEVCSINHEVCLDKQEVCPINNKVCTC